MLDSHISVASTLQDYIPITDHRPVCAYIIPSLQSGSFISHEVLNPEPKVSQI